MFDLGQPLLGFGLGVVFRKQLATLGIDTPLTVGLLLDVFRNALSHRSLFSNVGIVIEIKRRAFPTASAVDGEADVASLFDLLPHAVVVDFEADPPPGGDRVGWNTQRPLLLVGQDDGFNQSGHALTQVHLTPVTGMEHIMVGSLL